MQERNARLEQENAELQEQAQEAAQAKGGPLRKWATRDCRSRRCGCFDHHTWPSPLSNEVLSGKSLADITVCANAYNGDCSGCCVVVMSRRTLQH